MKAVLSSKGPNFTVLRGDAGLGKSTTLAALRASWWRLTRQRKPLLVAPRMLLSQFVDRLKSQGTATILLDRYQFRLMLDLPIEGDFWPRNSVIVTNFEFAMQEDIQKRLADTEWQLVIVDEAHSIRGNRAQFLQRIARHTAKIVFASAPNFRIPDFFPPNETSVVEWRSEPAEFGTVFSRRGEFPLMVESSNKLKEAIAKPAKGSWTSVLKELIPTPPRPSLRRFIFSPDPAERALEATIRELEKRLTEARLKSHAQTLGRSSRSSPAALEVELQKW